jgi:hypothetical protein
MRCTQRRVEGRGGLDITNLDSYFNDSDSDYNESDSHYNDSDSYYNESKFHYNDNDSVSYLVLGL